MWPNPHKSADLVTFTEEILNRQIHFLSSAYCRFYEMFYMYDNMHTYTVLWNNHGSMNTEARICLWLTNVTDVIKMILQLKHIYKYI